MPAFDDVCPDFVFLPYLTEDEIVKSADQIDDCQTKRLEIKGNGIEIAKPKTIRCHFGHSSAFLELVKQPDPIPGYGVFQFGIEELLRLGVLARVNVYE